MSDAHRARRRRRAVTDDGAAGEATAAAGLGLSRERSVGLAVRETDRRTDGRTESAARDA